MTEESHHFVYFKLSVFSNVTQKTAAYCISKIKLKLLIVELCELPHLHVLYHKYSYDIWNTLNAFKSYRAHVGRGGMRDNHHGGAASKPAAAVCIITSVWTKMSEGCFQQLFESKQLKIRYQQDVPNKVASDLTHVLWFPHKINTFKTITSQWQN